MTKNMSLESKKENRIHSHLRKAVKTSLIHLMCAFFKLIWFFAKPFKKKETKKIYWVSQYYLSKNPIRQKEIDDVFSKNSELEFLDGLIIFCERGASLDINHRNLEKRWIDGRLNFGEILKYIDVNHKSESDVFIITNSDIFLTKDLWSVASHVKKSDLIALTRYEIPGSRNPVNLPEVYQDTWIFSGGFQANLFENFPDIPFGTLGCDSVFAAQMALRGYTVWNPCLNVKTYHNHVCGHRTYHAADRLSPPYLHPLECCKEQFFVRAKRRSILIE